MLLTIYNVQKLSCSLYQEAHKLRLVIKTGEDKHLSLLKQMNILVDNNKEVELFDLGVFLSVTVMKGEAKGMCDQRLAKAQEGGQVA